MRNDDESDVEGLIDDDDEVGESDLSFYCTL